MIGTYPSLIEPPKEPVKKPSERIEEIRKETPLDHYVTERWVDAILTYLDELHSKGKL